MYPIRSLAALALVIGATGAASAAVPCTGVDTRLTDARRQSYAPLVAGALTERVGSSEVAIRHYLADGGWGVLGAEVPVADGEGFFFFERTGDKLRLRDTWAGYADPSELAELAEWARKLGAPETLARCFAHEAVAG